MSSIFITGASGFIGEALCRKMLAGGFRVKAAVRGKEKLLPGAEGLVIGSIETFNGYEDELKGVDTVVHLAGYAHSKGSISDFRRVNVAGTERLAKAAAKAGVKRFIFISSVKVNGENSIRPFTEDDPCKPQDAYGISKMEAEQALQEISSLSAMQTVILRLPLVYGAGVKANFKNLVRLAGSGLPLPLKSIRNKRSLVYLGNLIDAVLTCVDHPAAGNQIFMISDGEDVSTPELIEKIAAALNKRAILLPFPPFALKLFCSLIGKRDEFDKFAGSLTVDPGKIRRLLGWKPAFTLEQGINQTVKAYLC